MKNTQVLIETNNFLIAPIDEQCLDVLLSVYQQSEDFLALGPTSTASAQMVKTDIEHSHKEGGSYCGLWDRKNVLFGVLDFIPKLREGTSFLTLLMIVASYRGRGLGSEILKELEKYLEINYSIYWIESGVQINNLRGIHFWEKSGFGIEKKPIAYPDGTVAFKMSKTIG